MFRRIQHVHFVGIGGIGMSGIAEVLLNLGFRVSGSDARRSAVTDRLEKLGAEVSEGHTAEAIGDAQAVVRTTAVRDDNPEILAARDKGLPVIARGEMLAELVRLKPYSVAVAGSHGKTTTTSMIASITAQAGLDPTAIVGGVIESFGSNARLGKSNLMIVEGDESDRSFLMLSPTIAVITSIDREHMDRYSDMTDVRESFADFANKVPFYGASVLCLDDPNVQAILPEVKRRRLTYGLSAQADISAHAIKYDNNFGSTFAVWRGTEVLGEVGLKVPGLHNVYNALAGIAVGLELDIEFEKIAHALADFRGVGRRFQLRGEAAGVLIVDDYGHHPTEVKATLAAAKIGSGGKRTVILFQPHRYSRTQDQMDDFARAFNNADVLFVTDIYAASEEPIEGVTAEALIELVKKFGHKDARYAGTIDDAAAQLADEARDGDVVITLGAGNVSRVGEQLLTLLNERNSTSDKSKSQTLS